MRIAINGYGRIGRCIVRALYESGRQKDIRIVGINELFGIDAIAHLTRFDSTHGRFNHEVETSGNELFIDGDPIRIISQPELSQLPWKELDVDIVFECSGSYVEKSLAMHHLESGARKVLFSCPAQSDVDATVVYGLNHHLITEDCRIVSNASCTTNCISHVIRLLDLHFGIENGIITTVHSMMNDQPVLDAYHNPDFRKSRSSSNSIIPVNTGLDKGIDRIFPKLQGRFKTMALRVPVLNVSTMQLAALVSRPADTERINTIFTEAALSELAGIIEYTDLPLVSCDFNHNPHSAIIDGSHTNVSGTNLINFMAWFDNEWGYANRMLDTAEVMHAVRP